MILSLPEAVLRPWSPADLGSLVRYANNFKIAENMRDGFPHPYTDEHGRAWIELAVQDTSDIFLAIEIDGYAAGGLGITMKEDVYRLNTEIAYWLAEDYWNKGIMTQIIRAVTSWIFQNLQVVRIYATVFEKNKASMRVLEKSGYILEAIHRKAVFKNEVVMDEYVYASYKQ